MLKTALVDKGHLGTLPNFGALASLTKSTQPHGMFSAANPSLNMRTTPGPFPALAHLRAP